MQKKIIALAVAGLVAAPAFAQSNVQITGLVGVAYNNYKVSSPTRAGMATESRLDDQTSRFTVKGTEDLGGGLSAYFQIENRVNADVRPNASFGNAQGLADGESFVGLKHNNLGSIGFGKFAMHYHETLGYSEGYRALNTFHYSMDLMGTVGGLNYIAFSSRAQNAIKYDSPNWNGLSFKLGYSFNPAGNEGVYAAGNSAYNKGAAWNAAVRYNKGPFNAYVSYWTYDVEGRANTAQDQKSWKIGGDYKFDFGLKLGLHYDRSEVDHTVNNVGVYTPFAPTATGTVAKRNAWMLPVSYSFGPHAIYATYIRAGDVKNVVSGATGAKKWVLAYDYALSRRTYIGASYTQLKNETNGNYFPWLYGISSLGGTGSSLAIANAGEKYRQFGLNLTHFF